MRKLLTCTLVIATVGTAAAQPGQYDPAPVPEPAPDPSGYPAPPQPSSPYQPAPPPPPQPYPPQPYYPPQPHHYQPPPQMVPLTPDEQALLAQGEITDGQHIGGGALALMLGFGSGQAVQGRWSDTGWIFTLGEAAALTSIIYGATRIESCFPDDQFCSRGATDRGTTYIVVGLIAFMGLRIWEVGDAFVAPSRHNARVRELRARMGYPPPYYGARFVPYLRAPTGNTGGTIAGLGFQF